MAQVSGAVLAGLLLLGVTPTEVECVERCGCIPPESRGLTFEQGVAESLRQAAVVFRGHVVSADAAPSRIPGVIRKEVGSPTGVARLVVLAAWKGEVGDTVVMTLRSATSCDMWMREGEEYVVFATRLQDGSLYTRQCTGTVRMERADSTIAALGAPIRLIPRHPGPRAVPAGLQRAVVREDREEPGVLRIEDRPARAPYVWSGALLGAGVAIAGILIDDPEEDIMGTVVYPLIVTASAVIGAGLGWVVHAVQH